MPDSSRRREWRLVYAAGFLYTLSLHKYFVRDPLSSGSGIQGYLEATLICSAFVCCIIATRCTRREYTPSSVIGYFATFGAFVLISSLRSFNPILSFGEGVLFFVVLGIGYLASRAGLVKRLFQSIYWTYTASLAVGLSIGILLPSRFPLFSIDDYNGRTRLSVFHTFPGVSGETAAYLILLAPLLFKRSRWASRLFLLLMNIAAGGKTSTVVLILLLLVEYFYKVRVARPWRVVTTISGVCALLCVGLYVPLLGSAEVPHLLSRGVGMIYGHDVGNEAVSLDGRLEIWRESIALLRGSPALGYGFDGVRITLINIASWSGQSHNGFLELGLAGGIPAVGIFLMGLFRVFRATWCSAPQVRRQTMLVFVYMMIIALTGITFNHPSDFGFLTLILLFHLGSRSMQRAYTFKPSSRTKLSSAYETLKLEPASLTAANKR